MDSAIISWIEETRRQPSDDLLRLIIKSKGLGFATARRIEQARRSFVPTFGAYMDREADRLLDAARDQRRDESRDEGPDDAQGNNARAIDLGDGGPPLTSRSFERAWRVRGSKWRRERSGRELMLAVIRHLASLDTRGRERFYDEVTGPGGWPLCSNREAAISNAWRRVEPGIEKWIFTNHSNRKKQEILSHVCSQVQRPNDATIHLGEDIEVLLDI